MAEQHRLTDIELDALSEINDELAAAPDPMRAYELNRQFHMTLLDAAKNRYRMPDASCELTNLSSGRIRLAFADCQWSVTPGQSAVLYQGDICLGGGVIV